MNTKITLCPCGSNRSYPDCCGRYLDGGETTPSAEALMRCRYTAYTLGREDYLLASWHRNTRPASLDLAPCKWLWLKVKRHESLREDQALVEFVASYKVGGRAHRLHEISRFLCEDGRWYYLNGDVS